MKNDKEKTRKELITETEKILKTSPKDSYLTKVLEYLQGEGV
jgi:hypothetical protein